MHNFFKKKKLLILYWIKNLPAIAGDLGDVGLIPGLGRSPGEGNGNPLQCSCLENPGRNINNLRYADDTTLTAESEEELKSLLMKVKEESEKLGLKFNIQKTNIMASGPITSWEIDGETVETVSDFIFLGSKITADGHCSHEIKDAYSLEGKL